MNISAADRTKLKSIFPEMDFVGPEGQVFAGELRFTVRFRKKGKQYDMLSCPDTRDVDSPFLIHDAYQIKIDFTPPKNPYREVSVTNESIERVKNVAQLRHKHLDDLHMYADGKVCLEGYFHEDHSIGLVDFVCGRVVPFFYDQSFFEKNGHWPRGDYSHGPLGILENYFEYAGRYPDAQRDHAVKCLGFLSSLNSSEARRNTRDYLLKKKIKAHWNCVGRENSGSSRRQCDWLGFQECHPLAFQGIKLLHRNIRKHQLKELIPSL